MTAHRLWFNDPDGARKPVNEIKEELLAATPLGSDPVCVQEYIRERWGKGAKLGRGMLMPSAALPEPSSRVSGQFWQGSEMSVVYGTYYTFPRVVFPTHVRITWYFDERDRLEMIGVLKFDSVT